MVTPDSFYDGFAFFITVIFIHHNNFVDVKDWSNMVEYFKASGLISISNELEREFSK